MPITHSAVVIRFGRLGDTIMLQPLLHKLQLRYGRPCRLLTLGSWSPVLYSAQPEVEEFIPLKTQSGPLWMHPQRWLATLALHRMRDAPFYICEPEFRTQTKVRPMLALAGVSATHCTFIEDVPERDGEHWLDWLLRFGDTTPVAFQGVDGAPAAATEAAPRLQVSMAERADRDTWLYARGLVGRPLVLLQPANKRTMRWNGVRRPDDDDKSWPAQRWIALCSAIRDHMPSAQVMLCGSPAESGYVDSLVEGVDTASLGIHTAVLPLSRLKALMEVAHGMVSVDTGPAHLAAAVGCPLVVLFGARSPARWAPRSACGSAVIVVGGLPVVRRIDEIDTAQVVAAWRRLAKRTIAVETAGTAERATV